MLKKSIRIIIPVAALCILVFFVAFVIIPKFKSTKSEPSEGNAEENMSRVKATPVFVEAAPAFRGELIVRV